MLIHWLKNLFQGQNSRLPRRRRHSEWSRAETLEIRRVLTMLAPVGAAAGTAPAAVDVHDFNNDGINDVVTLNSAATAVTVMLGNGDGSFQPGVNSSSGGFGSQMTVADLDHDGKLDIVTNQGSSIDLLKGNGDGSFQLPKPYFVGAYANDVTSGDFNNDGLPDVATASFSYGGTTQIFINDGAGSFLPSRNLAISAGGLEVESGDVNGDGNLDLIQSNGTGYVGILMGQGDGTFTSISSTIGITANDVKLADLNHDGKSDIVVANGTSIKVFSGNGAATFQNPTTYSVTGATQVQLADMNGDGNTDIITNNGVAILGRGTGGFYAPTNYGSASGTTLAVGDLNGDGGIDAVATVPVLAGGGVNVTFNGNNDIQLLAGATQLSVATSGSATAGSPFAVTVTALDAYGQVVTNFQGTVGISGAPGTPAVSYTFSAADGGIHTIANAATLFTAGTGSYSVTSPFLPDTSGTIIVNAAAATKFSLVAPTTSVAGAASSLTVSASDAYGNFSSTYTGTVHFSSSDVQAGLPSDYTFTAADGGTHTFSGVLKTAGLQTITATDVGTTSFFGITNSVTITAAEAASLSLTGGGGFIGSVNAVTITARDAFGNIATSYNGVVHLASSNASSTTSADAALTNGIGVFTVTPMTLGLQTLTATDVSTSLVVGSEDINVTPGWGSRFVATSLSATVAGQSQNTTVTVYDSFGNVSTVYTGWVAVTTSDARSPVSYVYFSAADAGIKTIPVTLYTSGSRAVTISDYANPGVTVTQTGINVAPAAPASVSVTPLHGVTAGVAQTFTVTVLDAYGNIATNYRGTLNFSSSDTLATFATAYTFTATDAGVHTFSLTFKTSGGQSLTVTESTNPLVTSTQKDIQNTAAAMSGLSLRAQSNVTAGTAFFVTLQAVDAFGNVVTGYTGKVHFTGATGGGNILPADYTFTTADAGSHQFSFTFTSTGTQSIGVQDTANGTFKGQTSVKVVAQTVSSGGGGGGGTATGGGGGTATGGGGGGGGGGKKVVV